MYFILRDYEKIINDWYQLYFNDIYRYILLMVGDHEQAKDLTQETFIKAYENIPSFKGITSDKNWNYRIARTITIDFYRRKKPIQLLTNYLPLIPSEMHTPEQIIQLGEQEEQLYKCLKRLKKSYQEVIILRKINEFQYEKLQNYLIGMKVK